MTLPGKHSSTMSPRASPTSEGQQTTANTLTEQSRTQSRETHERNPFILNTQVGKRRLRNTPRRRQAETRTGSVYPQESRSDALGYAG